MLNINKEHVQMTLRIPNSRFHSFVDEVHGAGKREDGKILEDLGELELEE